MILGGRVSSVTDLLRRRLRGAAGFTAVLVVTIGSVVTLVGSPFEVRREAASASQSSPGGLSVVAVAFGPYGGGWEVNPQGSVTTFGGEVSDGSVTRTLNRPIVGMASTPDGGGYWLVASDGGVFSFGDADFYGSTGGIHLNRPIVGMASTPDGGGYWLVASDGGVFSFGDADFYGSTGGIHLNRPIVGMASTPDGGGYWLVASDGGVFSFGDADFYGSTGGIHLNRPIVGMASTPDGGGYWLVASDGGVFAFGDADFYGSGSEAGIVDPVIGISPSAAGLGYSLVDQNGVIYPFGDAAASGSSGQTGKIALGIAMNDPTDPSGNPFPGYRSSVGTLPSFLDYYQDPWSESEPAAPPAEPIMFGANNSLTQADHLVPVISWGTNTIPLNDILSGLYNAYIDTSAAQVKAYPGSVYIRLDWEMNSSSSNWNPANQPAGTSPATFVAFWRYVVDRFRADGVSNARWIWSPNIDGGDGSMAPFYPGDGYVDMVGLDGYNKDDFPWESFGQIFQASYREITGLAPGKPVMIAETSTLEATPNQAAQGSSKSEWIRQMAAYIPAQMPAVTALCWYEQPVGTQDFRVESSAASLAAWKQYVVDNPAFEGRLP